MVPPSLSLNVTPQLLRIMIANPHTWGVGLGVASLEGWGKVGGSQQTYLKMIAKPCWNL